LIFEEEQDRDVVTNQRIVNDVTSWIFSHEKQDGSGSLDQVFAPRENSELKNAIEKLVQADYQPATSILTRLSKNQPGNSEMHYWLGIALSKTGQMQMSKKEFQTAFKNAATGTAATPATPTAESLLPNSDTKLLSSVTNQMPTVIAFGADWAEQCGKLDKVLTQSANLFGDRVRFLRCNVDDPKNLALVQTCQVGPIPTIVFLKGNGTVSSVSIGQSSFINFAEGVSTLLR
jgi:thioredoxin 1